MGNLQRSESLPFASPNLELGFFALAHPPVSSSHWHLAMNAHVSFLVPNRVPAMRWERLSSIRFAILNIATCGLALWVVARTAHGQDTAASPRSVESQTLRIENIAPPSWWAESTVSPLRLLLRGEGFTQGTVLESTSKHLRAYNFRCSENGHYFFADLAIAPACPPGEYPLTLRRGEHVAQVPFTIRPRHPHVPAGYDSNDFIYFVMPDRFCDGSSENNSTPKSPDLVDRKQPRNYHGGDLRGLTSRLAYLESLGITAIWTTPLYDNNDGLDYLEAYPDAQNVKRPTTGYHGYGAIDMYAVDEHLGTSDDLHAFIDAAHARGMKVIQDQVANHTGPYHVWTKDPPTPTWWNGTFENHRANNWQKWTAMNPRATPETRALNLDGWFIDILPDFNQDDPEVSRYLIQNSIWWIGTFGFDAVRMDTLPHVPRSFWQRWTTALKQEFPRLVILGELFDSDPVLLSYYQKGRIGHDGIDTQIDSLFDFGLFTPLRNAFAKGKSIREVHQMFAKDWIYPNADALTTFVGVHDMERFMHEPGATVDGLKSALTLITTSRGTPLLYYGDELAMAGGPDPDNRRDFPGGFPGDARDAFVATGRTETENDVWNHVARLGALRREWTALRQGKSLDLLDAEQQYAFARVQGDQAIVVAFNNDSEPAALKFSVSMLPSEPLRGGWSFQCDDRLDRSPPLVVEQGIATVTLPGRRSAIYVIPSR